VRIHAVDRITAVTVPSLVGAVMRFMSIRPFARRIEILDFGFFLRSRFNQATVLWPEQAVPLVGYMAWPNDSEVRAASVAIIRGWFEGSRAVPRRLRQIQTDWARVADIFNLHLDLTEGGHQQPRGGPSIGKAIAVAAGSIRTRGAHAANLWRAWKEYKDVAHLVAAAAIITAEVRRAKIRPLSGFGLGTDHVPPFTIAMLMPDFVLSLALSFQEYGLNSTPQSREEPMLDPETLWRIAPETNVVAVPPPVRKLNAEAIALLQARRAGNRGKAKRSKSPPVTTGTGISAPAAASGAAAAEHGVPDHRGRSRRQ
jgi:hypothetical protein